MIWAENDPATKTVTQVDDSSTADETDNVWESSPKCQEENLKVAKENFINLKGVHLRLFSGQKYKICILSEIILKFYFPTSWCNHHG